MVVGGVAGGASFAARARRLDESAEILLLQVRSCRRSSVCVYRTYIIYIHTSISTHLAPTISLYAYHVLT